MLINDSRNSWQGITAIAEPSEVEFREWKWKNNQFKKLSAYRSHNRNRGQNGERLYRLEHMSHRGNDDIPYFATLPLRIDLFPCHLFSCRHFFTSAQILMFPVLHRIANKFTWYLPLRTRCNHIFHPSNLNLLALIFILVENNPPNLTPAKFSDYMALLQLYDYIRIILKQKQ